MPDPSRIEVARRAKSEVVLNDLSRSILAWLADCEARDVRKQHATQLAAIRALLTRGLTRMQADLALLPKDGDAGALFAAARRLDTRIVWFDRLWRFFEAKFAQRADHSPFKTVLRLADEMVWSCYRQVFDRAPALGLTVPDTTAPPLPFVESRYSPAAFPSQLVPDDLKGRDAPEWLGDLLNRMPISVVRIPPSAATAPWSLVLLAHEVGHHVQYDLLPDKGLVSGFRTLIEEAVRDVDSPIEAARWGGWSVEIFADVFSAACLGPWAVRAMFELEFTHGDALLAERAGYPPVQTRLGLLAAATDRVTDSTRGTEELRGLIAVDANDPVLNAVLEAALGPLPELDVTLSQLCNNGLNGALPRIDLWTEALALGEDRAPTPDLRSARILMSATYDAWDTIAAANTGERLEAARSSLCERAAKAIVANAPDDERGAAERDADDMVAAGVVDAIWKETA